MTELTTLLQEVADLAREFGEQKRMKKNTIKAGVLAREECSLGMFVEEVFEDDGSEPQLNFQQ